MKKNSMIIIVLVLAAVVLAGSVSLAVTLVCALYAIKNVVYAIFRI